jgi:hypothetical protein
MIYDLYLLVLALTQLCLHILTNNELKFIKLIMFRYKSL